MEALEDRRLMSAALTVSQSLMVFNVVKNSGASPVETLTLTNTGDAALSLTGLSVVNDPSQTNQEAARFTLVNGSSAPASLAAGASFALQVNYTATAAELDYALLDISSSDPNTPLDQVQLHGIGTAGTGGGNQPSLELILQAYDEPNYANVGESNEASAYYPEPPAAGSDEVPLQELVKAGSGPVTINVLASFTAASTKPYTLGWYNVNELATSEQQLFYTPTSESQSVYVQPQGVTSFDPGSTVFGFYNPSATVKVNNALVTGYTQDDLNTYDSTDPRKFRFFPLETSNGTVVPNSYIMTSTEYFSPAGYDFTNIVAIISNVTAAPGAPTGPVISINNPDALPDSSTLIFNRIQIPNATVGDTVHDTNTITLENTGTGNLTVSNITVAATTSSNGGTQYVLVNPPTMPFTLTAGQTQAVQVQFVLSQANANSHSANETNSAGNGGGGSAYPGILTITSNASNTPTQTIPLEGWWQEHSENENEPSLQTIVNMMAGYGTDINPSSTPFLTESYTSSSAPVYYGEEVVSPYWTEADSTQSVGVKQLAAFHSQGATSGLNYFAQGSTSTHSILSNTSDVGQSFFPTNSAGNAATGTFTTTGSFGFEVLNPNTYSDSALNVGDDGGGHLIRFYPVRNSSGNLVPNTYILAVDYPNGADENFDFNDCVYLVTNIRPTSTMTVSSPQSTGGAAAPAAVAATETSNGVSLQWVPVIDTTLTGYNIYSSLSATTGYALLNSTPTTAISFVDTSAQAGQTVYYRVAAVNSLGVGLGVQTSVATSGTATNSLESIGINETPVGSTTTITPNQQYTVVAGGPGVTGTSDGFRYLFAPQTGNFDVAVQVSSLTVAGNFSTAGIMARDSLSATGANVYMSASPVNYRFKYRTTDDGTEALTAGTAALTYPDVWVRLVRAGDVFSGYTSTDGVIWTLMSQVTLSSFPTTCYLGMAVASNTAVSTTTAQLANYGNTIAYNGPVTIAQTYSVVSGQSAQEQVLANDVDPNGTILPNTFAIVSPPNGGGTVSFDPTTELLTYTSAAGFVGSETLSYTVADSNGIVSSPTTVTFVVADALPVAIPDNFQAVAGQVVLLNVLANDSDATSTLNPASVSIVTQPTSGATVSVNATTGVITYLAPTSFTGTDTFTYTVSDYADQISLPGTVTVTVSAPNVGELVTVPYTGVAVSGVPVILNVLANDSDTSGTIVPATVAIATPPSAGGTAVANSDGTITYTAASGNSGVETFLYTVSDSAGHTSSATLVTLTVSNPTVAPIATGSTVTSLANGSVAVDVASSVQTTVGLNLATIAIATAAAHGTTSISTTGVITYTPAVNYVGPDIFSYTVADNNGHTSNLATVNVNTGINIGTVIGDDRSLTFTPAGGAVTTLSLNRGSVEVLFTSAGTLSVNRLKQATVTGASLQISELELSSTTSASTLAIAARGNKTFVIGGITDTTPIRTISAPAAIISGSVNLAGISTLAVQQASDAVITVGAAIPTGFSMSVTDAATDSTLTSAVKILTLRAGSWSSSTVGASTIVAPSISSLVVATGNFQPTLTLNGGGTALRSASIKGALSSNAWNVIGNVGTIVAGGVAASLQASVSGTISNFTIRGGGFGAALTAGSLTTLSATGGLTGSITASSARIVRVVGSIAGATLNFTGGGTSVYLLSVTGSITGTTLTTAGNVTAIVSTLLSDDTILIGAVAGTTLADATTATVGGATLSSLHLTARGTPTFSDTALIVHTLTSAVLGAVDTTTTPNGIALSQARSITGTENGTAFRFTAASTVTDVFGNFEIELVTAG